MAEKEWQRLLVEGAGVGLSTTVIEWLRKLVAGVGVTIPLGVDFPTLLLAIGAIWGRDKVPAGLLRDFVTGLGLGAVGQIVAMFVTGLAPAGSSSSSSSSSNPIKAYVYGT